MKAKDFQAQMILAWTEAQLQNHVQQLLDAGGWTWHHETDSRKSKAGFPDLVMVHPQHGVLWRELKTEKGRLRPDQTRWLDSLHSAGEDADVWRPRDVVSGRIREELLTKIFGAPALRPVQEDQA